MILNLQWQMPPQAPRKTKQEKIDEILANLKDRVTTEEANLGEVLKDKKASRKQYPEAQGLLVDVSLRNKNEKLCIIV